MHDPYYKNSHIFWYLLYIGLRPDVRVWHVTATKFCKTIRLDERNIFYRVDHASSPGQKILWHNVGARSFCGSYPPCVWWGFFANVSKFGADDDCEAPWCAVISWCRRSSVKMRGLLEQRTGVVRICEMPAVWRSSALLRINTLLLIYCRRRRAHQQSNQSRAVVSGNRVKRALETRLSVGLHSGSFGQQSDGPSGSQLQQLRTWRD